MLPDISWDFLSIDKTVHVFMFTVLVFLGLFASNYGNLKLFGRWPIMLSISSALAYGYILELIQSFVPQRSYDFADLAADCVGTLVGYGLFLGMSKILPNKAR
jgi:VanZ family protein